MPEPSSRLLPSEDAPPARKRRRIAADRLSSRRWRLFGYEREAGGEEIASGSWLWCLAARWRFHRGGSGRASAIFPVEAEPTLWDGLMHNLAQTTAPTRTEAAAVATLEHLGYTWNGGERWRPPLGPIPDFPLVDRLRHEANGFASAERLARRQIAGSAPPPFPATPLWLCSGSVTLANGMARPQTIPVASVVREPAAVDARKVFTDYLADRFAGWEINDLSQTRIDPDEMRIGLGLAPEPEAVPAPLAVSR